MNHKSATPARWWNNLICNRFITPDEPMSPLDHPPEKILIFTSGAEFPTKTWFGRIEYASAKNHISGPTFTPGHLKACWVSWPFVETPFNQPARRFLVEVRFHRAKHTRYIMRFARPE